MERDPRRIVAVETSGQTGSVALATTGGRVLCSAGPLGVQAHASELMPALERLLRDTGWSPDSITDVFVSIGPGSFTGLRVGVSLARTLAWAIGARIVAVPTLDSLACNALCLGHPPRNLAVLLDAKSARVFCAAFELHDGAYRRTLEAQMSDPRAFLARCPRPLAVLGEGVARHPAAIVESGATVVDRDFWAGRAESVVRVGWGMAVAGQYTSGGDLLPCYIRRPEPEEKWEKRHASV